MKKQGFIKGSAILVIMIAVTKALGIIYKVPLTILLGGGGMGHLAAAMSVFTPVFAAAVSGITPAVARLTAENSALGRHENMRKTRRIALRIFFLLGALGCSLLICGAVLFSHFDPDNADIPAVLCAAPTLIFCALMSVEKGYYEGLSNMLPTAAGEIAESALRLICGLGLGYTAGRVLCLSSELCAAAAVLGTSVASMFGCVFIFSLTLRHGDGVTKEQLLSDPVTDSSKMIASRLIRIAAPVAFTTVVNTFTGIIDMLTIPSGLHSAAQRSPHLFDRLTAAGVPPSEAPNFIYGSYTALALTVFGLVPTVTGMLSKSLLPEITSAYAARSRAALAGALSRLITAAALISVPLGVIIAACPREILAFLFGSREMEIYSCERAFMILGAAAVFSGLSAPCFAVLQLLTKPYVSVGIMLGGAAVKLSLNVLLIPMPAFAFTGAAISTAASSLYIFVLCLIRLRSLTFGQLKPLRYLVRPIYAGALCFMAALISPKLLSSVSLVNSGRMGLIAVLAISCMTYVVSLVLLCEMPKNAFIVSFFKKKR